MSFLDEPPQTEDVRKLYDADVAGDGYVHNFTKLWSWRPDVWASFLGVRGSVTEQSSLTPTDVAVLVASTASELGDAYCSLAWGRKLAALTDDETAADVVRGGTGRLSNRETALSAWARRVVRDPNSTTAEDVAALRAVGLGEREIFEATAFVALRLAFSTVNDALGAAPDGELSELAPPAVRDAVSFGRPPA